MESSDAELIEASWANAEVFGAIFDRHFAAIYGFCVSRVGAPSGEDVAGETFLRAFAGRRRFDVSQQSARPWLYGIAHNVVRERLRAVGLEKVRIGGSETDLGSGPIDPAVLASVSADAQSDLRTVARALQDLPADEVETLLLYVWDGLTYSECAVVLGVPLGTVRSRLNRLRHRLRERIGEAQEDPETPIPTAPLRLLGGTHERPA